MRLFVLACLKVLKIEICCNDGRGGGVRVSLAYAEGYPYVGTELSDTQGMNSVLRDVFVLKFSICMQSVKYASLASIH